MSQMTQRMTVVSECSPHLMVSSKMSAVPFTLLFPILSSSLFTVSYQGQSFPLYFNIFPLYNTPLLLYSVLQVNKGEFGQMNKVLMLIPRLVWRQTHSNGFNSSMSITGLPCLLQGQNSHKPMNTSFNIQFYRTIYRNPSLKMTKSV